MFNYNVTNNHFIMVLIREVAMKQLTKVTICLSVLFLRGKSVMLVTVR